MKSKINLCALDLGLIMLVRLVQTNNEYLYFVGCVIVPVSVNLQSCGLSIVKGLFRQITSAEGLVSVRSC